MSIHQQEDIHVRFQMPVALLRKYSLTFLMNEFRICMVLDTIQISIPKQHYNNIIMLDYDEICYL